MARACGQRLLRLIVVCAILALISLLFTASSQWPKTSGSSTQAGINSWAHQGVESRTGGPEEKDYFPLLAGDDRGHLELPIGEILQPDLVPPDVHFIWCGERWFEFKNYLSVMSVRRAIQPDKIYIHYENTPPPDRVYYHQVRDRRTVLSTRQQRIHRVTVT